MKMSKGLWTAFGFHGPYSSKTWLPTNWGLAGILWTICSFQESINFWLQPAGSQVSRWHTCINATYSCWHQEQAQGMCWQYVVYSHLGVDDNLCVLMPHNYGHQESDAQPSMVIKNVIMHNGCLGHLKCIHAGLHRYQCSSRRRISCGCPRVSWRPRRVFGPAPERHSSVWPRPSSWTSHTDHRQPRPANIRNGMKLHQLIIRF